MFDRLTNKEIAAILYVEASKPLDINQGRAVFTIDGLTIRCNNTRSEIELVAAKFHKNRSCQRAKPNAHIRPCITPRKAPYKELSKLYAEDPDQIQFAALFNPAVMQHLEAVQ